jgi:hypothetical protein
MRFIPAALALLLAGCASLSPEQCLRADWRQIGFSDGATGLSAARISDHAKACAELGIRPNLDVYLKGREQGLRNYCHPENGFAVGRRGGEQNAADCPEHLKYAFLDQYRRGYRIHMVEEELARQRAHIDRNNRLIRRNEEQIAAIKHELAKEDLPGERRTALLNDYNRLLDQKNALWRETAYLHSEANRLQSQLQGTLRGYGY